MASIGTIHRVLRDEGFAEFFARLKRYGKKRARFAAYRWTRRADHSAASPADLIADELEPGQLAVLNLLWQLGTQRKFSVVLPDFLHCPLASVLQLSGHARLSAFTYSWLIDRPDQRFDALLLHKGLLHRLPLELVRRVLREWQPLFVDHQFGLYAPAGAGDVDIQAAGALQRSLSHSVALLEQLQRDQLLYSGPFGTRLRCHYSEADLAMIEEVRHEYFGWDIDPRPTDVVVDIGANLGAFAVACGMRTRGGTVYAYEPCPENFELLVENVARNCPGAVQLRRQAVSRVAGSKTLYLDPEHSGAHTMREKRWAAGTVTVECVTLATILEEIGRPVDLLKIDAEGSEYDIVFPAGELIRQRVRTIIMEVHRSGRWNCRDMVDFLKRHGFAVETRGASENLLLLRAHSAAA